MTCSASPWREHLRKSYKVDRKLFSRWRYGVQGRERGHGKGPLQQDMHGNRETEILCAESLSPSLPVHRMYREQDVTRSTDRVILCRFWILGLGLDLTRWTMITKIRRVCSVSLCGRHGYSCISNLFTTRDWWRTKLLLGHHDDAHHFVWFRLLFVFKYVGGNDLQQLSLLWKRDHHQNPKSYTRFLRATEETQGKREMWGRGLWRKGVRCCPE